MADLISVKDVMKKTSLSRTTIWRMVESSSFPAPVPLTEVRKAFVLSEIDEWVETRIVERIFEHSS